MLAAELSRSPDEWQPEAFADALGRLLIERGRLDEKSLDRGRRLAADGGGRLDAVLTQLGLVSERNLAEATAELLGLKIAMPPDYPAAPILADRLRPKFLRKARAVPIEMDGETITVAMADPLDRFAISAINVATGRDVAIRVAVPIDLEAAFERLYSKLEPTDSAGVDELVASSSATFEEDDAERLKDNASEAPIIRLVNQLISQAVETRASDIHIDPI